MTWDCTGQQWGNATSVSEVIGNGQEIHLHGHHPDAYKFAVGDLLILRDGKGGTTRYLLETIKRPGNPPDQWFGTASFFPREAQAPSGGA